MAEDFPRYRYEDLDDDDSPNEGSTAAPRRVEHAAMPEQPAASGQEGMIFSRDAKSFSRPLLEIIRNQEQAGAKKPPEERTPESDTPPSVSTPEQPEMRVFQPPAEAAGIEAVPTVSVEDDDDSDDEDRPTTAQTTTTAPPARPPLTLVPPEPQPLNKHFEDVLRSEMGEDFARLTNAAESSAEADQPSDTEHTAPEPAYTPAGSRPRHLSLVPPLPEQAAPAAEAAAADFADEPVRPAANNVPYSPAAAPSESGAFYYTEDEPDAPDADPLLVSAARSTGIPPRAVHGFASRGGGIGGAGGPGLRSMNAAPLAPMAAAANVLPNMLERRENHNGRWFVAGFITGWVVKQHLANKRLSRVQAAAQKQTEQQNAKIDTMTNDQVMMERRLQRNEALLQEAQAAQAERARQTAVPGPQAEQMPAPSQSAPAERPAVVHSGASVRPATEAPLRHPGAGETAFATAAAVAETPVTQPRSAETAAVAEAKAAPEQVPQALQQSAAEELVARAYDLQRGQHIEHATGGGHNIVVDKHGHEVQNAITYGEEFHAQQRQEQARTGSFAAATDDQDAAAASQARSSQPDYGLVTGLESGLADSRHSLPSGLPSSARQRLLAGKNENPVVATITSPWLWAALIVLLLAFFAAAFI